MSIKPGTRIGSYEVTSPLGEGGMDVVFRARDTKLQRGVALKANPRVDEMKAIIVRFFLGSQADL